jgi:hypothetical protein
MSRHLFALLLLWSCTHNAASPDLDLPTADQEQSQQSQDIQDQAAGMQVRSDETAPLQTEKKKCRPKAERGGASQPAPQIEVGIARPVGDGNAKPHAYTRFEDCQE